MVVDVRVRIRGDSRGDRIPFMMKSGMSASRYGVSDVGSTGVYFQVLSVVEAQVLLSQSVKVDDLKRIIAVTRNLH